MNAHSYIVAVPLKFMSRVAMNVSDIDECALPTGGHICSYRCHNTPGSFHCSCPTSGYTLAPNGRSCQGKGSSRENPVLVDTAGFSMFAPLQMLMNAWQEHTHAQRIKAALTYKEDSGACPSNAQTTTGASERRECLDRASFAHICSRKIRKTRFELYRPNTLRTKLQFLRGHPWLVNMAVSQSYVWIEALHVQYIQCWGNFREAVACSVL